MNTQRGEEAQLYSFFHLGATWGWVVNATPRPGRFTPGNDPVPTVQEGGWAPGPVRTGAENLAPIGIRSPDRPARSESLSQPTVYKVPVIITKQWRFVVGRKESSPGPIIQKTQINLPRIKSRASSKTLGR